MRIVFTSYGTLGDVLPYVALGQALAVRGHQVGFATSHSLTGVIRGAGLEAYPVYPEVDAQDVRARHADFSEWRSPDAATPRHNPERRVFDWEPYDIEMRIRDLLHACRDAGLMVRTGALRGEGIVQELLGIPAVHVTVGPERLWNPDFRGFLEELESERAGESAKPIVRDYYNYHQEHRRKFGLPQVPASGWTRYFLPPTLLGASRHILGAFDLTPWKAIPCGFWFYAAPEWRVWQPDSQLRAFMDRRPAPLVLSYSSQPVADSGRVVSIHRDAARQIGRPLLVQGGWAGFTGVEAEDLMFRGFMPQDWLFEKAGCVIHHGGIGTIARALRNGCPMLVEPHAHDQFFNALLVVKGGFGAAVNPARMGPRMLARVLAEKVLAEETKRNAAATSLLLQGENGLDTAVSLIEGWHGGRPNPVQAHL